MSSNGESGSAIQQFGRAWSKSFKEMATALGVLLGLATGLVLLIGVAIYPPAYLVIEVGGQYVPPDVEPALFPLSILAMVIWNGLVTYPLYVAFTEVLDGDD